MTVEARPARRFRHWLLKERIEQVEGPEAGESKERQQPWWKVVCLRHTTFHHGCWRSLLSPASGPSTCSMRSLSNQCLKRLAGRRASTVISSPPSLAHPLHLQQL